MNEWTPAGPRNPFGLMRLIIECSSDCVPHVTEMTTTRTTLERWGILPSRETPKRTADLLSAPRPPAEVARHHALLAPEVQ